MNFLTPRLRASACHILSILLALALTATASAADPFITIGEQKFFLAYAPEDSAVQLREYLPKGETLKRWNRMASVRVFKDLDDPQAFLASVAESVEKSYPAARSQFLENEKEGKIILDFLTFDPENSPARFAEWNLMRAEYAKGRGLVVFQYAMRFYKIDDRATAALNAERERMVGPFGKVTFTETTPTP